MEISLYYQERGKGVPLILLHGNGESSDYFRSQIAFFSRTYRVIAVDTRGHGKSPRGTAPFTIAQFARDLHDFMTEQKIPAAILLGFSDGANIAMKFALQYPNKVSALILNGGNLNPSGVKSTVQLPIVIGYPITRLFAGKSDSAKKHMELLGLMVHEPNISVAALRKIKVPTLVIAGTRDMIRRSHTMKIAANIPHAKLVFIAGNHFIADKKPKQFNLAVASFLDSCPEIKKS